MTDRNNINQNGKIFLKLTLGISSLGFIFLSPYLNLTEISINMSLFNGVIYSLLIIGFWITATKILHNRKPTLHSNYKNNHLKTMISKNVSSS